MKIAYCSDLHLEFKPLELPIVDADVLVLAGDIVPLKFILCASHDEKYQYVCDFFDHITQYRNVIWVMGNHEYYGCNMILADDIKKQFSCYKNLHILLDETVVIDGVKFAGGTKWTNMNNYDPLTILDAPNYMMDFRLISIRQNDFPFTANDWLDLNKDFIKFINANSDSDVVITHHSPSFLTTLDKYKKELKANGYYCDSLEELILDSNFKLWLFGHQHGANDIDIGQCKIRSNARGYPQEDSFYNFELKVINIC